MEKGGEVPYMNLEGYPELRSFNCPLLTYASTHFDVGMRGNTTPALISPTDNGASFSNRLERTEHYRYRPPLLAPASDPMSGSRSVAILDHNYDTRRYHQQGTDDTGTHNTMVNHEADDEPLPRHGLNNSRLHAPGFGSVDELRPAPRSAPTLRSLTNPGMASQLAFADQDFQLGGPASVGGQNELTFIDGGGLRTVQNSESSFSRSEATGEFVSTATSAPRSAYRTRGPRSVTTRGPYVSTNRNPCGKCKASHIKCTVVSEFPSRLCQHCEKRGLSVCA